jgi:dTDP-4-amino-4,6-dideoxygalactose transaminase
MTIGLFDLARQRAALEPRLSTAIQRVLDHGGYINGPEVAAFEAGLANHLGGGQVIGCSSGTDALVLMLMAAGIGPNDAVIVPSLTFIATAQAVALTGAIPVFADVRENDQTLCPESTRAAIAALRDAGGPVPRAVIAVDLFSLPADHGALAALCAEEELMLFYDAAHSVGTQTPFGPCGLYGKGAASSFYPSKALGAYGDAGGVLTTDPAFAARIRQLAHHGAEGAAGHTRVGMNGRLDTLQAAILLEKLTVFADETQARQGIAARYLDALDGCCGLPSVAAGVAPVWSYFCITHSARDSLQAHLAAQGVATVAYYRVPTHLQPAYRDYPVVPGGLPVTQHLADRLLCLPAHAYLREEEVARVIQAVQAFSPHRG